MILGWKDGARFDLKEIRCPCLKLDRLAKGKNGI